MRRVCLALMFLFLFPSVAFAQEPLPLTAASAILIEQSTGRVLYAANERERMYPASMTKVLTALVVADHLSFDDVLLVGPEIRLMPAGYNTAIHFEGESITVRNLIRALIIRSGNETGHVLAINVVRKSHGRNNITYEEAERLFSALMNEKARELGAMESHFNNPYGFQSDNHYTTAYDMALIARAYMENPELAAIAAEWQYIGDSLEGQVIEGTQVRNYEWTNHNELLFGGSNTYPYATGIKTGFTNEAGYCFAGSATKMGFSLISVVFKTPEPSSRFQDTRLLLDYGFFNYAIRTVQTADVRIDTAVIANNRLGETNELEILTEENVDILLSTTEFERVQKVLTYDEVYMPTPEDEFELDENEQRIFLKAPIEKNTQVGVIQYLLDGQVIYEGAVIAAADVLERDLDSDMDYYIQRFRSTVFTADGLPYWFGLFGTLFGIIGMTAAVRANKKTKNDRWRSGYARSRYK